MLYASQAEVKIINSGPLFSDRAPLMVSHRGPWKKILAKPSWKSPSCNFFFPFALKKDTNTQWALITGKLLLFLKNDCTPSTKAIHEDPWKLAWVSQGKPVKRFHNDRRQSWGVGFFSRVSHRRLLLNNAQHTMSLAIVNSHEDKDSLPIPTPPPPKLITLPRLIHLFSTSPMTSHQMEQLLGSVIEMWVDRMDNITQPERRKLSALALLSLLPSDNRWEKFHYWSLVPMGQVYEFTFCFIQGFWCRSDDVALIDCSPTCL